LFQSILSTLIPVYISVYKNILIQGGQQTWKQGKPGKVRGILNFMNLEKTWISQGNLLKNWKFEIYI
jgi:hypothetical protein